MLQFIKSILNALPRFPLRASGHALHHPDRPDQRIEIALVILLDDTAFNCARRMEKALWDHLGADSGLKVSPHISLKLGFYINTLEIALFESYLDKLASETETFDLHVGGIGRFPEGILFLEVKQNIHLEGLRQRVLRDLSEQFGVEPNRFEGDQFHFHVTLANELSDSELSSSQKLLEAFTFEHRFALDTIGVLIRLQDGWTTYKKARVS